MELEADEIVEAVQEVDFELEVQAAAAGIVATHNHVPKADCYVKMIPMLIYCLLAQLLG